MCPLNGINGLYSWLATWFIHNCHNSWEICVSFVQSEKVKGVACGLLNSLNVSECIHLTWDFLINMEIVLSTWKRSCALVIYVQVPRHYLMQNILLILCHIQSQSHCVGRWTRWRHLGANVLPSSCMPLPNSWTRPQGSKKCCRFAFGSGSARRQTCLPFVYNNSNSNRVKRQQQQQQC